MKRLAHSVSGKVGIDIETIERVISLHQSTYPGSWQDWDFAEREAEIVRVMTDAKHRRETSPERIILRCA